MSQRDFDIHTFRSVLKSLPEHLPVSDAMSDYANSWYDSQREHMLGWFAAQGTRGVGSYTRQKPNWSARTTYNRLLCPGAVIWIAEALGVNDELVKRAAEEAQAEPNYRRRCGMIRKHIPWEMIAAKAAERMSKS